MAEVDITALLFLLRGRELAQEVYRFGSGGEQLGRHNDVLRLLGSLTANALKEQLGGHLPYLELRLHHARDRAEDASGSGGVEEARDLKVFRNRERQSPCGLKSSPDHIVVEAEHGGDAVG